MGKKERSEALHPLDMLRAGRWKRALFGTYTLSLGFFEATPLRALRRAGVAEISILADISGVADALGEAGAREVGRTYAVEPLLVRKGCFHPKFMLLDSETGPRMFVGSGNLTFSGWGRNLELAEFLTPEQAPQVFADMADFLSALAHSDRVDFPGARTAESWAGALRRIAVPGRQQDMRLIHNVDEPIAPQLAAMAGLYGGAEGLLVASPYFGKGDAVQRLAKALGVNRPDVHVSSRLALAGHHYDFERHEDARPVVVRALDEAARQRPMHAKLLEVKCRDAVLTVSGSVNASGPALMQASNVELAVVRVGRETAARRRFKGALPVIEQQAVAPSSTVTSLLQARLVGRRLSGSVLGAMAAGSWDARLDAAGLMNELGPVEVGPDRSFSVDIDAADEVNFGTKRAVLILYRGDERISGFVTFPDLLELNGRLGTGAGAMIRVIGGSTDDEDWAGVFEYYARHPDETSFAWASGDPGTQEDGFVREQPDIALMDLDIRPREDMAVAPGMSGGASALARLAATVRRMLLSAPAGSARGATIESEYDAEGDGAPPPPPEKVDRIFETLCELLAERVPLDPATELHRLGELGICVLARRPDAARLTAFVGWWCTLAASHLRQPANRPDLIRLATVFLLMDGLADGVPQRTRRRMATIIGDADAALLQWKEGLPAALKGLIEQATAGYDAVECLADAVRAERSPLEELPILLSAIRAGVLPPPLARLDQEPETDRIRQRILQGFAAKIPIARSGDSACPKCRIGLPQSDVVRLSSVGLVEARNCCGRVIVLDVAQS
ncbi:hypothetical protein J2W40_002529 [Sphingobium xenophagum]|uniref:PLD phosphodiesterase domain-containing protein n=1 Tax=Sphingobium xenophagum TaxID=121428 RepID=A0ABU1X284_SPHXE|nr:hypothetical protein [Sphingobium xenophagum]MDR7155693.1 hypothetical protein [Sphingobium xenophagum]